MKKAFVVDECFQCPHFFKAYNHNADKTDFVCDKKDREVKNPYAIPKWCPLPDYIKKEAKT